MLMKTPEFCVQRLQKATIGALRDLILWFGAAPHPETTNTSRIRPQSSGAPMARHNERQFLPRFASIHS